MKRVFIVDEYMSSKQNGVGTYLKSLLCCLKSPDVELNVLSFNAEEKEFTIFNDGNVNYFYFPICAQGRFLPTGPTAMAVFRLYVSDSRENVFFVNHSPCELFLAAIKTAYPLSKLVFTIHDQGWTASLLGDRQLLRKVLKAKYIPQKQREVGRFVRDYCAKERKMYRIANAVICLTEDTCRLLQDVYEVPSEKISIIPNGMELRKTNEVVSREELRKELGIHPYEKVILFAGRPVKAKGIEILLKAFEKLYPDHPEIKLVIAGQVFTLNDYAELTEKSLSHIVYTGLIPTERLNRWYQAADIGVLPSYKEQCSFTGIEMLMQGLVTISTDGQGLREMFHDGQNALIAKIGDRKDEEGFVSNLVAVLQKALLLTEEERKKLSHQAQKDCSVRYSLEQMRNGYQNLLNRLYDNTFSSKHNPNRG